MQPAPLDLARIAEALSAEPELRYVLIGGLAVMLHGGARVTMDADLAIAFDLPNRSRIVSALAPLNPRPLRLVPGAEWVWDEKCVRAPWSMFLTDAGRLDLMIRVPGVDSFDALFERSETFLLEEIPLRVASVDDLLGMKAAADRDRDRDDYNQLLAIKRLQDATDQ